MKPRRRGRRVPDNPPSRWQCGGCKRWVSESQAKKVVEGEWTIFICPTCGTKLIARWQRSS